MTRAGKRGPPGKASQLRLMAHSDPAAAEAVILAALHATEGHRRHAAVALREAGLLGQGRDAYIALRRLIADMPGLTERIDAAFGARFAELGGAFAGSLDYKPRMVPPEMRAATGAKIRARAIERRVAAGCTCGPRIGPHARACPTRVRLGGTFEPAQKIA